MRIILPLFYIIANLLLGVSSAQADDFLTTLAKIGFQGEAASDSKKWPFIVSDLTVKQNGEFEAKITWSTLDAVHAIQGVYAGDVLWFTEVSFIQRGDAILGCEYTINMNSMKNGVATGTWGSCHGSNDSGAVLIDLNKQEDVDVAKRDDISKSSSEKSEEKPGAGPAENPLSRYGFLSEFTTYSEACTRGGAVPMTPGFYKKLKNKMEEYARVHGITDAQITDIEEGNKNRLEDAISTGWLDGPQCWNVQQALQKNLNDPTFWQ